MKVITPVQRAMKYSMVRVLVALCAVLPTLIALPPKAHAAVFIGVSVGAPPPPLPVYTQPAIPGPGYIWTPGYWAWNGAEYYWVPGTWVLAPFHGALWTPCYWAWDGRAYVFHPGYWGRRVGFYGGINYGYGYPGTGYVGGYWGHGGFYYNRAVNHFGGMRIPHIYNRPVLNHFNRISYNGGHGGIMAHATPQQMAFARQARMGPIAAQRQQMALASHNRALRAAMNHGHPPIGATPRPGAFGSAVPHGANTRFGPTAAALHHFDVHAGPAQPRPGMTFHAAHAAPHVHLPNAARPVGSGAHGFRPSATPRAAPAMPNHRPAVRIHSSPAQAFRPRQAYHPPQQLPRPQPHFRPQNLHPVPAARPIGAQPHGGGYDLHH